ncbi:Acylglycerophosphoethanolamine acyltransferase [Candidatus Filomicrobium marinum]|uniref:Acylglycerophosphoethanolamine acyltransferase n=1 Tax=Candidatus Filomicrobium marinum TaxID=1608628 RepID=A0A0D6JG08_9HYPH|nr:acyl-[ACP]--phospholipid O-acyltransferase [Candidatus Filomicrobium marinum]CFX28797.1 Acylglycerophosphoethanolamine acyltransferase [Candidatus Filomicrobium marinum]CPR19740.1 Acylglycerophosphoethanolamine acyltransferase [Candidatus Filomicrobium marinum]
MFSDLMTSRRFAPLFWCQFLSALNDNFIKNALVILVLFKIGADSGASLVTLAGAVLVVPFFFLSALGGELADKYDKAKVAVAIKLAEFPIAVLAAVGFVMSGSTDPDIARWSIPVLFSALFLFGSMAALFGPIKYGILPDHLQIKELPAANALVEGATFLAILGGTIAGGYAMTSEAGQAVVPEWVVALLIVSFALCGWLTAKWIKPTGGQHDLRITPNPLSSTFRLLWELHAERRLWIGGLITSWFWTAGIVALSLLPTLVKDVVNGTEHVVTLGLIVFVVGIAIGSFLAARASHMRPNLALVPIGALLMGLFSLDIAWVASAMTPAPVPLSPSDLLKTFSGVRLMFDLAALAAAGGLFIVPAFAAVQAWAKPDHRARVVAAVNILNAAFMSLATLAVFAAQVYGATVAMLFAIVGIAGLIVTVGVLRAWGREGVRDVARFIFKSLLGLEVTGLENLPPDGERVIIAPNHVSFLDAPILYSILPGHAGYAIDTQMAQTWWIRPFLTLAKTWSIDPTRPLGARSLISHVKDGETLVIFPEGRLTVTGGLMKVYDGTAMIADKSDAVVVPVRIDGPERSPFGYMNRMQTKKVWLPKTRVSILPPVKLDVPEDLRGRARRQSAGARLQDIMVEAAVATASTEQTLFQALAEARRTRDTGRAAIEDPLGTKLSYAKLITSAQVLGAKLKPLAGIGESVGVLLPNSAGVAVTFFALQTIGRVPAMLNFTAGSSNLISACKAAKIKVILTSRAFIEKARLGDVVASLSEHTRIIYLEDVRASISAGDKLRGVMAGSSPQVKRKPDSPAVILFTSGSEGAPKGVVLSHRNMLANAMQSLTRVAVNGQDRVFNVLPVFHSFGLTAGLVMPLVAGVPVFLYPTPLHYRIVPELVYQTNATILFGTDTFLNGYARTAHPYDFARVRLVLAGAEPIKDRTRSLYMDKFGVRILEGYGVTETAPVLAINTPLANKAGTVGRLSPLMEARLEPVPGIEEGGRLFVRGPNVMLGYLHASNPGVLEPPENGWHDTGDIVTIDENGFITIRGRAKRFAKIGGEMVSLAAVEALATELWPSATSVVVALPDQRKGERLILMTNEAKATRAEFLAHARASGANELSVPAEVLVVSAVPLLGSGKPDYPAALVLAKERLGLADINAA